MAKLHTQSLVIQLSQLLKNGETETPILSDDLVQQLEAVVAELAGAGVLVEIEQA